MTNVPPNGEAAAAATTMDLAGLAHHNEDDDGHPAGDPTSSVSSGRAPPPPQRGLPVVRLPTRSPMRRQRSASDATTTSSSSSSSSSAEYSKVGSVLSSSSSSSSSFDSNEDASSMEAAALVTYQQMMQGRPILLGRNRDSTCNVQLPSGRVIVVESSAFPEFKQPEKDDEDSEEEEEERPPSLWQDPHWRRFIGTSSQGDGKSSNSKNRNNHQQQQRQSPAICTTKRSATVEEIEEAIPSAASCVFHIFDRRVNLDQHGPDASNYALLRSWVQDDPYRVRLGASGAVLPPPRSSSSGKLKHDDPPVAAAVETHEEDVKQREIEDENKSKPTMDVISALQKMQPVSLETLKTDWISNAKRIKREKTKEFLARDQLAVESLQKRLGLKL